MYQTIILGSVLFVTLYALKRMREPKLNLNMPPLVPYRIPIIGHTYSFFSNSEEFLLQCRKEYGDIFSLYIWGQIRVFVGKEHSQEILTKDSAFDFKTAFDQTFPGDALLKTVSIFTSSTKTIKDYVLSNTKFYSERVQVNLYSATQKHFGDCDKPKVFNNYHKLMTQIVSVPIANILIGEEESQYDEIVSTFAEFTRDVGVFMTIPPFFDFIYPGLQDYVNRIPLRLGYNPAIKHQELLIKHIKKQVCKRLEEKEKFGDSWKRPSDFLQDIIEEESFDPNNIDYTLIADRMCVIIFASVHTTSKSCANSMMDLASRPEYMKELYEEQLEVHKEANEKGILPFEALDKMKKLDSFIRESFRLTGMIAGLTHAVLKDYTFSNGLQVPKDYLVDIYFDDIYRDESSQGPNPKSFEPFRYVDTNIAASKVTRNFLHFGGGKHACPGRHFAVNAIKFFMHNAILKYNFYTESGKIEEKNIVGPMPLPSSSGIIFEKRVK